MIASNKLRVLVAVDALIARVEMLEALLRERGLPVPGQVGVDE